LFPNYALGDISGAALAKKLFDTYMKDMSQNLSWEIGLNYKGQAEQDIAANYASAMKDARYAVDNTGTPTALNSTVKDASNAVDKDSSGYRGIFESVVSSVTGKDAKVSVGRGGIHKKGGKGGKGSDGGHADEAEGNTTSGPFDWKERSTQICNQITARGMKAYDFGCLKEGDKIKDNFSWRGYTRMVCTRLGTVYDPSVPELCGCPPPSWIGWRP
jgi:hypothetical protein